MLGVGYWERQSRTRYPTPSLPTPISMIPITHLNATEFFLNTELIESVEATPDTVLTLTTGKKILVRETVPEVVERIKIYQKEMQRERE